MSIESAMLTWTAAKAGFVCASFAARLKACPDTNLRSIDCGAHNRPSPLAFCILLGSRAKLSKFFRNL